MLPLAQSGQRSPCAIFGCATSTFFAPRYASAPLRPCPFDGFRGGRSPSDAALSGSLNTELVFSVLDRGSSLSASACNAVLSFWLSDSLKGVLLAPSMIRSSSATFTSMRRRGIFFFIPGSVSHGSEESTDSPTLLSGIDSAACWWSLCRALWSCRAASSWRRDNTCHGNGLDR